MARSEHKSNSLIDNYGTSRVLRLLDTLKKTPAGGVVYQQIERILYDADQVQDKMIRGYTALVLTMIEAYRQKLPKESLLYLELKLIQKRLLPPVSISEISSLLSYINKASHLINELSEVDDNAITEALEPLLGKAPTQNVLSNLTNETDTGNIWSEQQVDSLYRQKLDQQHREFNELQNHLSDKLAETAKYYDDFNLSLNNTCDSLKVLRDKDDTVKELNSGIQAINTLQKKQQNLAAVLNETRQLLNKVNLHSQKLSQELNQVRVLSLTDDLTHLPNRRAFIRRLEDEINRSQRESAPLILGILDLDYFKDINDRYGHNVGDEILQSYARDILSVFRHYDMVSRYGGEEFAVILPNTDHEGAMRAFNKVRNKAAGHYLRHNEVRIALPTFSAGLAQHRPGEISKEFIKRVDALLYKAKQSGRNRIEIEKPTAIEKEMEKDPVTEN